MTKCGATKKMGSLISCNPDAGAALDVARRCSVAHAAYGKFRHVWKSSFVSLRTMARLLMACVSTVLSYGSETWFLGH